MLPQGSYPALIPFSAGRELTRLVAYTLPCLGFMGYLIHRQCPGSLKPRKQDLCAFGAAILGLGCIGIGISSAESWVNALSSGPAFEAPQGFRAWLIALLSSAGTGYLEESYFRVYLVRGAEEAGISRRSGAFFSCLLFALCHSYEGPWGVLQAALAGGVLSWVFTRYRAIHGIALAHGAYNSLVYLMSAGP
jgi:membrane protease YdiL (CAAX protease family)